MFLISNYRKNDDSKQHPRAGRYRPMSAVMLVLPLVVAGIISTPQSASSARIERGYDYARTTDTSSPGSVAWSSSIHIYDDGTQIVIGQFGGTVDFDDTPEIETHSSNGGYDIFLTKYDSTGSHLWTKTLGGTGDDYRSGFAIDSIGAIYITGSFIGTVDFDPGSGVQNRTSNGAEDIFLLKLNQDANYEWVQSWGGPGGSEDPHRIELNSQDEVYVSGRWRSTVDFDLGPGVNNKTANGAEDTFLLKFDSLGNSIFAYTWGSSSDDYTTTLEFDDQDNLYVAAEFRNTIDFDPGITTNLATSNGSGDIYLSKFDSDDNYLWTKTWGGTSRDAYPTVQQDTEGNIIVHGRFQGSVDFDPTIASAVYASNGSYDFFLSKFDSDDNYLWTKTWGGTGADYAYRAVFDKDNNAYLTGSFQNSIDFDPSVMGTDVKTSNGSDDAFLMKLDQDHNLLWAHSWGGTGTDYEYGGLVIDSLENIYIGTWTESTTFDMDPGASEDNITLDGSGDQLLSIFSSDGTYISTIGTYISPGWDYNDIIAIDDSDHLYLIGYADSSLLDFDPYSGVDNRTLSGNGDMFLLKLNATVYQNILGLAPDLQVLEITSGHIATNPNEGILKKSTSSVRIATNTGIPIVDVAVSMNTDRNWSGVTASTSISTHKSVVSGLALASGVLNDHSLYVPKQSGDNTVSICPNAQILSDVSEDCPNQINYTDTSDNVSIIVIDGQEYWLVSGLSGTGGFSTYVLGANTDNTLANTGTSQLLAVFTATALIGSSWLIRHSYRSRYKAF